MMTCEGRAISLWFGRVFPALAVLASMFGCGDAPGAPPIRNVVVVVIDTLRADHLESYGYQRPTSPFLAELARGGVLFEDASSPAPQTVPAVLSLWSGVHPSRHGVQYFPASDSFHPRMPRAPPTAPSETTFMAEYFRAAGFQTGAVVTNPWLQSKWGFAQGFDWYMHRGPGTRGAEVNAAALEILDDIDAPRFLLYLHYMDVHAPYLPSEEYLADFARGIYGSYVHWNGRKGAVSATDLAYTRAVYDAGIRTMDDALREFVVELSDRGLLEQTLLVVTGDHGEEFYEHEGLGHGHALYGELLRVPLVITHPSLSPRRIATPVGLIDVLPTLLALTGIATRGDYTGVSLLPLLRGQEGAGPAADRPLFFELGWAKSIRRGDRKLIRHRRSSGGTPTEVHFDLSRDHEEALPQPEAPWAEALREELDAFLSGAVSAKPMRPADREEAGIAPGSELEQQLKLLGYLDDD